MVETVIGRPVIRALLCLSLMALAWCAAGCATPNRESDLPWNMQQPWETAPSIPGFTPQ